MADTPTSDAIVVAQAIFRALESNAWADVTALVDSDALEAFRQDQLDMAHAWEEHPHPGRPLDPAMPAAVVEYFETLAARRAGIPENPTLAFYPGVSSLAQFEGLSAS